MKTDQISRLANIYKFSNDAVEKIIEIYGERAEELLAALRRPPSKYFIRVNTLKVDTKEVITRLIQRGMDVHEHDTVEEAIFVPVKGPFELPQTEIKIVADKFAAESVIQGAHLYAPGVKKCQGLRKGQKVTIVDELDEAVGVGIAQMDEKEVLALRKGLAVKVTNPMYFTPTLRESKEFELGYVYSQSFPAIITSKILDPMPGDKVVDLCAAPGGKTSHLAQLMNNEGQIVAAERHRKKIRKLLDTITRLGVKNTQIICHDARYLDVDFPTLKADKVLVDPPCSCLGVRPQLFGYISAKEINSLSMYQKQLLKVASKIVNLGGIVVYSTCTLTVEENEEIVRYAIENYNLELIEEKRFSYGSPGVQRIFNEAKLTQRFEPDLYDDCPGYFVAKMKR